MKFLILFVVCLLFGFSLVFSPVFGYTASKFVSDYGYDLTEGQKIKVLVKVKGVPESEDPTKRAKEIRFLQSAVLKFCNFAGATNVKTDTWNNEFTAIVTTSLAQVLEERSDVISVQVIETSSAQTEQITSKIWLITSDEFGCSPKNQEAIEFLQSIAFVYLSLYGVKSEFSTSQCLYITQIENDPDNFLSSIENYDLPIIIFDSEISSDLISKQNDHHYQISVYEKPHIVFCYCSIPAKSHTETWELSHQLSHFILESYGESKEISEDWVHEAEEESVSCVNIRKQYGLCSDRWTPVFGNFPMEMMTVKIHPDYFRELGSIDQLLLSQEQNKKIQPESAFRNMIYDLVPNVDVEIVDLKIIPMDDKPKDPFDDSDVMVITFEITNRGIDYFVLSDKMFKILVMDPSFPVGEGKPESRFIIENYFTLYDVELETRYDDYPNLEIFEDCEYLHDRVFENQTETYSICFDVLRKWDNKVLNIDGPEHYFLTLMDNNQFNSCPNCVENLLSMETKMPQWFENNLRWYDEGKISKAELENAIKYLEAKSLHVENTDKCYREKFPIDWSGCNLYGKVLPDIDYRYANLSNANLAGAIFSGKDLSNANLSGAFLKYAEIDNANLTNADLSNAKIIRGWVRGSDLSNANLSGAYLWNTDFTSSNLTNVNFQDTTLTYAILAGTDLKDANLDGAGTWSTNLNDCYNHPICE
ncbi:MAG TPA: pentapeptide repeat-containing protein [Nitrosopumilus sp.]|nr:pentapeptide repeat-containing protein [Nitrosopumilus sp.]